jgi:hypothetical protein
MFTICRSAGSNTHVKDPLSVLHAGLRSCFCSACQWHHQDSAVRYTARLMQADPSWVMKLLLAAYPWFL